MRIEGYGDIPERDFRHQTSDDQTGKAACGIGSTCGGWHSGGRFLDYARNDRDGRDLRKEV